MQAITQASEIVLNVIRLHGDNIEYIAINRDSNGTDGRTLGYLVKVEWRIPIMGREEI